jgi:hypothetical protein
LNKLLLVMLSFAVVGCRSAHVASGPPERPAACPQTAGRVATGVGDGEIRLEKNAGGRCEVKSATDVVVWDGGSVEWDVVNNCGTEVRLRVKDKSGVAGDYAELDQCPGWTEVKGATGEVTCTLKAKKKSRCVGYSVEWKTGDDKGELDPILDIRSGTNP